MTMPPRNKLVSMNLRGSTDEPIDPRKRLRQKMEEEHLQQMTQLSMEEIRSFFGSVKHEKTLEKEKFAQMLDSSGFNLSGTEVAESFFNALDVNGDGSVDKKELIVGLMILADGSLERKLELSFHIYDTNNDGKIEKSELETMITSVCCINKLVESKVKTELQDWVKKFVQDTFEAYDVNHDDGLSFAEFKEAAMAREDIRTLFTLQGLKK